MENVNGTTFETLEWAVDKVVSWGKCNRNAS